MSDPAIFFKQKFVWMVLKDGKVLLQEKDEMSAVIWRNCFEPSATIEKVWMEDAA